MRVVFVTVPEAESLRRNSMRKRVVPEDVLLEKFDQITYAASVVSEALAFVAASRDAVTSPNGAGAAIARAASARAKPCLWAASARAGLG